MHREGAHVPNAPSHRRSFPAHPTGSVAQALMPAQPNLAISSPIYVGDVAGGYVLFDIGSFVSGVYDTVFQVIPADVMAVGVHRIDVDALVGAMRGAATGPIIDASTITLGPPPGCPLVVIGVLFSYVKMASLVQCGWPGPLIIVHHNATGPWAAVAASLGVQARDLQAKGDLFEARLGNHITLRYPFENPPSFWPLPIGIYDAASSLRSMLRAASPPSAPPPPPPPRLAPTPTQASALSSRTGAAPVGMSPPGVVWGSKQTFPSYGSSIQERYVDNTYAAKGPPMADVRWGAPPAAAIPLLRNVLWGSAFPQVAAGSPPWYGPAQAGSTWRRTDNAGYKHDQRPAGSAMGSSQCSAGSVGAGSQHGVNGVREGAASAESQRALSADKLPGGKAGVDAPNDSQLSIGRPASDGMNADATRCRSKRSAKRSRHGDDASECSPVHCDPLGDSDDSDALLDWTPTPLRVRQRGAPEFGPLDEKLLQRIKREKLQKQVSSVEPHGSGAAIRTGTAMIASPTLMNGVLLANPLYKHDGSDGSVAIRSVASRSSASVNSARSPRLHMIDLASPHAASGLPGSNIAVAFSENADGLFDAVQRDLRGSATPTVEESDGDIQVHHLTPSAEAATHALNVTDQTSSDDVVGANLSAAVRLHSSLDLQLSDDVCIDSQPSDDMYDADVTVASAPVISKPLIRLRRIGRHADAAPVIQLAHEPSPREPGEVGMVSTVKPALINRASLKCVVAEVEHIASAERCVERDHDVSAIGTLENAQCSPELTARSRINKGLHRQRSGTRRTVRQHVMPDTPPVESSSGSDVVHDSGEDWSVASDSRALGTALCGFDGALRASRHDERDVWCGIDDTAALESMDAGACTYCGSSQKARDVDCIGCDLCDAYMHRLCVPPPWGPLVAPPAGELARIAQMYCACPVCEPKR